MSEVPTRSEWGTHFLHLFLIIFFYLLWTGRQLDNFGRGSWIEAHVMMALALVAGLCFRVWLRRTTAAREKMVGGRLAVAVVLLVLFGSVTEALVLSLAVGRRRTIRYLTENLFPQAEKVIPVILIVLLAAVSNLHPVFVAGALAIMTVRGSKLLYGEEVGDEAEQTGKARRWRAWELFNILLWLLISLYYLYGQILNNWSAHSISSVCSGYPYAWLQTRCRLTSVLVHTNTDLLFDIALVVFVVTAMSAVNLLGATIEWFWASVTRRRQSPA